MKIYETLSDFCLSLFQNTYTNAEKLLAAAEELAQTGECNAEDIYRYTASLHLIIDGPLIVFDMSLPETSLLFVSVLDPSVFGPLLDPDPDPFVKGMNPDPAGLEKTRFFFLKNPAQWVFLGFLGFLGFFGFFGFFVRTRGFFGFFLVSRILLCASRL